MKNSPIDPTPEELEQLRTQREKRAMEAADRQVLEALLPRAKSTTERRALQEMIAARGGARVTICKCGAQVMPESGELLECSWCYAKGYEK